MEAEAHAPRATPLPAPAREAEEAAAPAPAGAVAAPGTPAPVAIAPAPEPAGGGEVFASFSPARLESEKRRRAPLYIGIAAVVVIGGVLALILARRGTEAAPATPPTPLPVATSVPVASDLLPATVSTPGAATAALDPKAIEQEVQRQLAEKRQQMQKLAPTGRPTPVPAKPMSAPVAAAPPTETAVPSVEPTSPPPAPTPPPPEPTEVAVEPSPVPLEPTEAVASRDNAPPPSREPAPAAEPEVSRGDLVGPGPGVVEPVLVSPPRVSYPAIARQQRVSGRVVVLVLVTEDGKVAEARIQKGIGGRSGIDGVVLDAVRSSRFRPATKKGIPVKMWRTVVVDVKP
jgi:TonB family protein